MKVLIVGMCMALAGCSTVNNSVQGCNNLVVIEQPKTVSTTPSLQADGNTVPLR